jgi:hypothetical protein
VKDSQAQGPNLCGERYQEQLQGPLGNPPRDRPSRYFLYRLRPERVQADNRENGGERKLKARSVELGRIAEQEDGSRHSERLMNIDGSLQEASPENDACHDGRPDHRGGTPHDEHVGHDSRHGAQDEDLARKPQQSERGMQHDRDQPYVESRDRQNVKGTGDNEHLSQFVRDLASCGEDDAFQVHADFGVMMTVKEITEPTPNGSDQTLKRSVGGFFDHHIGPIGNDETRNVVDEIPGPRIPFFGISPSGDRIDQPRERDNASRAKVPAHRVSVANPDHQPAGRANRISSSHQQLCAKCKARRVAPPDWLIEYEPPDERRVVQAPGTEFSAFPGVQAISHSKRSQGNDRNRQEYVSPSRQAKEDGDQRAGSKRQCHPKHCHQGE